MKKGYIAEFILCALVSCGPSKNVFLASKYKLDLAFNNVKPKDRYFDLGQNWDVLRLTNQNFQLDGSRALVLVPSYSPSKS